MKEGGELLWRRKRSTGRRERKKGERKAPNAHHVRLSEGVPTH